MKGNSKTPQIQVSEEKTWFRVLHSTLRKCLSFSAFKKPVALRISWEVHCNLWLSFMWNKWDEVGLEWTAFTASMSVEPLLGQLGTRRSKNLSVRFWPGFDSTLCHWGDSRHELLNLYIIKNKNAGGRRLNREASGLASSTWSKQTSGPACRGQKAMN